MLGQVATLGRYKGIADVLGLRLRGFLGWFVTRSYHLYQLPLAQRKLRVVVDWTVALLFRRDLAELGMLGHPSAARRTLQTLAQRLQRLVEALLRRQHAFEEVAVAAYSLEHDVHRERRRIECSFTSSQRNGVETGAPARGRTEYADAIVFPSPFWFESISTPRRFDFVHSVVASPRCVRAIAPATISENSRVSSNEYRRSTGRGRASRLRSTSSQTTRGRARRAPASRSAPPEPSP